MNKHRFRLVIKIFTGLILFAVIICRHANAQNYGIGNPSYATPADVELFKDILMKKGIRFGTFIRTVDITLQPPRPANYLDQISQYFNFYQMHVTWAAVELKQRGQFDFSTADKTVEFAMSHNAKVKGFALIYGRPLPKWLLNGHYSPEELKSIMKTHIQTIIKHFKDKYPGVVTEWTVANEVTCNGGLVTSPADTCYPEGIKKNIWTDIHKPGSSDPTDYIQYAFEWAHEADPDAKLFLNEDLIEHISGQYKKDRVYNLVKSLKEKGVPIDGVGFEGHARLALKNDYSVSSLVAELNRYADLGLETEISETDVLLDNGVKHIDHPPFWIEEPISQPTNKDFIDQANIYRIFLTACLTARNCKAFVTMSVSDNASWTTPVYPGQFYGFLLDSNMQPKLTFKTLIDAAKDYDRKHQ